MKWIQYVGPYDRFSNPFHGIPDTAARTPIEVSDDAAAELLAQTENYAPAKAPKHTATTNPQEG